MIQTIMIIAVTGMIFSGVSQFANHAIGVLASCFYVVDTVIYSCSTSILTDTSFSFFVTLGTYALLRHLKTQKMPYLILCYAAVNFALLVRPGIMYLNMILFFGLLLLSLFKKVSWKKTLPYLLMFIVVYGGWCLRNAAYYGKPVYTTIRDDSTFLFYAPLLYTQEENCSEKEAQTIFEEEMARRYPDFDDLDTLSQTAARKDIGTAYIKEHIPGYIRMNFVGLFNEMFFPNYDYIYPLPVPQILQTVLKRIIEGSLALCYLIYAVGFFANIRKWTWLDWLLLLATMYLMASTAVLGYSRFRVAFYPVCVIGACLCWRSRLRPVEDPV